MKRTAPVAAALLAAALGLPAQADVWKVTLAQAKRDVHYLVQTGSRTVAFVQGQQCARSFPARLVADAAGRITGAVVETDLEGGQGGRGFQRLEFTLREGLAPVSMASSFRGAPPPVQAHVTLACRGPACAEMQCP